MKKEIGKFEYPAKPSDGSEWMHINFYPNEKFTAAHLPFLKRLLSLFYAKIFTYVNRGFYLSEGKFIMLSVNLKTSKYRKTVERIITDTKKVYINKEKSEYIEKIEIEFDTDDYKNGEGFLTIMNAVMLFNFFYEDNSMAHVIHCIMNSCLLPMGKEKEFYKLMGKLYG